MLGVGRLNLTPSEYYSLTPKEIGLILRARLEDQREQFEILANVISVGYARTQTKEKIELFNDGDLENENDEKSKTKAKRGTISKEERQKELSSLSELFS